MSSYKLSLFQEIILVKEQHRILPKPVASASELATFLRIHLEPEKLYREAFWVIPLSSKHAPLGVHQVSMGTLNGSLVHPREVMLPVILCAAGAYIVVHNHPSGDCSPSGEDEEVTERLREVGRLMGIPLLDHLILGENRFYSFAHSETLTYKGDV